MNEVVEELELLCSMKQELKSKRKAYNQSVKGLKNSIQALENEITKKVLEGGQTVTANGIRAEYKPTVVFKMKREGDN